MENYGGKDRPKTMNFADLGLSPEVLKAVEDAGYSQPTPIQEKAIPWILQGRDVLGCAQTGTGKTAGFTLPMIEVLANGRARHRMPRSLILEPTRELADQVAKNFDIYGKYNQLSKALLIGGVGMVDQEKLLERGVDVLIATPGRLMDHFERGKILLSDIKILVIDEADRMLDMGFIPDIEKIVKLLPTLRQTLFFSATMPPEIRRLADNFLSNPKEVSVSAPAATADNVEQYLAIVSAEEKREALRCLIRQHQATSAIVFCNRKKDVDILAKSFSKHGFNAAPIHGDLTQDTRQKTFDAFKAGEIGFLIASDVAARGLDVAALPFVFNFDVPFHPDDYVHRIGRTGRAGLSGKAFTLATPDEGLLWQAITKLTGKEADLVQIEGVENFSFEDNPVKRRGRGRGRTSGASGGGRVSQPRGEGRPARPARSETQPADRPTARPVATPPIAVDNPVRPDRPMFKSNGQQDDPHRRVKVPHAAPHALIDDDDDGPRPRPRPRSTGRPWEEIPASPILLDKTQQRDLERDLRRARQRQRELQEDTPLGLGDHVPAFFARPIVRRAISKVVEDNEPEAEVESGSEVE